MNTSNVYEIVGIILAITGIVVPIWRSRRQYGLRLVHLRPKLILDVPEKIADLFISVSVGGRPIRKLTRFEFILHNIGYTSLKGSPAKFEWSSPSPIVSARLVGTDPNVNIKHELVEDRLHITWELFNQKCRALFEVLCEGGPSESKNRVSCQIENITNIQEKQVYLIDDDEEERIRQVESSRRSQHAFGRAMNVLFAYSWFRRIARWYRWILYGYMYAYFIGVVTILVILVLDLFDAELNIILVASVFTVVLESDP